MSLFRRNIMMAAPKYLTAWRLVGNSSVHTDENLKSWSVAGNSQIHLGNLTQWKVEGNSVVENYEQDILPQGYTRCKYLEAHGTEYIELPVGFDKTDEVELTASFTEINLADKYAIAPKTWNDNSNRFAMGLHHVNVDGTGFRYIFVVGYGNQRTGNTYFNDPIVTQDTNVHLFTYANYLFELDNSSIRDVSTYTFGGTTNNLRLFYGYDSCTKCRIYAYHQVKANDTEINLIPCLDDNNVPCLYDTISETTYYNDGTGTFGYEVDNRIYSCGDLGLDGYYHVKISNGVNVYDIPLTAPLRKAGSVADKIEFSSGVATVTRNLNYFALSSVVAWSQRSTNTSEIWRYSTAMDTTIISDVVAESTGAIILSNKYTGVNPSSTYNKTEGLGLSAATDVSNGQIFIYDSDANTLSAAEFKKYVKDVVLIYQCTPTTETIQVPSIAVSPTGTYTSDNDTVYSSFTYVEDKQIWSCGDLGLDGKYHVKISNGVEVFDIALDEPLRKVNDVADTIEFPSSVEGKALVTRRIYSLIGLSNNISATTTVTSNKVRWVQPLTRKGVPAINNNSFSNLLSTRYPTSNVNNNWNNIDGCVMRTNSIEFYDEVYCTVEDKSALIAANADTEFIYELATPTTELIDVSPFPISATDTYTSQTETAYSAFTFEKNMEIWSCGEYSAVDNRYHIYVQSNGRTFDIALDEPLRKVGSVADKIEFTDGVATVTRNIKCVIWNDLNVLYEPGSQSQFLRFKATKPDDIYIPTTNDERTLICLSADFKQDSKVFVTISSDTTDLIMAVWTDGNIYLRDFSINKNTDFYEKYGTHEFYYRLATPTTETITVPQIQVSKTNTYTQIISPGAKAIEWTEFETNLETLFSYGVQWDITQTSPDVTRIGNMEYHALLPIQSQMRGCLLDDSGTVTKYLTQEDWNLSTLGDETHQVMIELPEFWWKFVKNGNTRKVLISAVSLNGYTRVPKMYVSAYEATIDRGNAEGTGATSTWKLASVKNNSPRFRGGNNDSSKDSAYNTLLQMPATNISLTEYRTYARRRKANSSEWNLYTFQIHKILYWLFVVEYATRNSQKAINNTLTAEGYHQGGLGNGPTNANDSNWSNLFSYYPFIPIGTSDSLGNNTGQVAYASLNDSNTVWCNTQSNRYRGIENPFGHIWKWVDGIHVQVESGENGESKVYVTDNPSLWQDSNNYNYNYVGNETRENSYVKDILFDDGNIMCSDSQTSSTQYYCDYHYVNIPSSGSSLRAVRFGGAANSGSGAGFVYSNASSAPSGRGAAIGSRLCFVPENF